MKLPLLFIAVLLSFPFPARAESTVDLQWSVCDSSPEEVLAKLEQESAKEKDGWITYYETSHPHFVQDGVTFRVKDVRGKNESSIKIRFDRQTDVPGANCEWDRYGRDEKYSCEMTGSAYGSVPRWSSEQRDFLSRYFRDSDFSSLQAYGPYEAHKWSFERKGYRIHFDTVNVIGMGQLMEFSLKANASESGLAATKFEGWLSKHDVVLCDVQESKTARLFRHLGLLGSRR